MRQRHKQYWIVILINIFLSHHAALANPVFVPQFLSGGTGRNIRHLPCVSRRTGETGVCMFAFTCAKANGTHLGTCIDRFYFGSCCKIDDEPDVSPQENTIDVDNTLALPKPFTITTITSASESNDIPGNIDKVKLTVKPESVAVEITTSVATTLKSTSVEQFKTKSTKITTKNPVTVEFTTESIRLSTFQSVQNASEQSPTISSLNIDTTMKRPQRPSISNFKPLNPKPKPTITSTPTSLISETSMRVSEYSLSTPPNIPASTLRPLTSALLSTTNIDHGNATVETIKKPVLTLGVVTKPESMYHSTTSSSITSMIYKKPAEDNLEPNITSTSTHRTPPTRFPPRNATTGMTFNTEINNQSITPTISTISTSTASTTSTFTTTSSNKETVKVQKISSTRKPLTTKKFTKSTTKRPSTVTKKPLSSTVTRRTPILSTNPATNITPSGFATTTPTSLLNSSTKVISNFTNFNSVSSTSTTTKRSTKKPLTTIPNKTSIVTKRPLPTITSIITSVKSTTPSTIRRNVTNSSSVRPITPVPLKSTSTTRRPTISSTSPLSTTSHQSLTTVTTIKPTTLKIINSTTDYPKVTKKPTEQGQTTFINTSTLSQLLSSTSKPTVLLTTTAETSSFTNSQTELNIKPVTQSHILSTSVTSSNNQKNETLSPTNTSTILTVSNEIDSEFDNEMDQTTSIPGIVTWSSLSDEVESSTKNVEYSSPNPDTTETNWAPITTPDGWIIIQSPTTAKTELQADLEIKPISTTTQAIFIPAKPSLESTTTKQTPTTTTQRVTTQSTTYIDMLSTLATISVSSEFTEPPLAALNMSNFKEVCGRRLFPEARIVGGDGSTFGKWPWQISLRQWRTSTYLHKCGAALLNENWAITAAHCVQNVLPSDLLLRIGEHDLGNEEEPYGFQERRIQIVASHPNFDPRTFEFDLALMRFYEPVLPFQPNVLPICIPDDDEDYVGQTAYVTGWGRLYEDGPLPSVLQEVAVPVINNSVCEGMYRNAGYIEHIPHIFICAGWRKGGFDSCEGDSGGPLVIQRKRDKRWILAGVISWGIGCAEPNQPGVYTRISEFREWINQILQF